LKNGSFKLKGTIKLKKDAFEFNLKVYFCDELHLNKYNRNKQEWVIPSIFFDIYWEQIP